MITKRLPYSYGTRTSWKVGNGINFGTAYGHYKVPETVLILSSRYSKILMRKRFTWCIFREKQAV